MVQLTEQNADQPTQNDKSIDDTAPQDKIEETSKSPIKHSTEGKTAFLSSDDEETDKKDATTATDRMKKKHKKPILVYSGMETPMVDTP